VYDLAYGGNYSAIVELSRLGLPFDRRRSKEILQAGLALVAAIVEQDAPPPVAGRPAVLRHAHLLAPGADGRHSRHAMVISPGWFDRSPCGTGTAGRMAALHARGQLALHEDFVNESFIGTRFTGRLIGARREGDRVVLDPRITGRAWITGTAQHSLDPDDALPQGFLI
jgi:proline racemase